ncbi:hypothetical protein PVIIG_06154 [Plasmodium vivax India VII]|uniref:Uncharacterized protein n=1 Tax=Plasmodium vivax India VII TaxID=1077284 RepID=A0A0J9SIL4_PLAVI|nr:hypothetical protein PVIIG_06154 [Plasmodium vivax India VII]
MGGITIKVYDKDQTLDSQECFRIYYDILDNIEGRIAEFEGKEHKDINEECKKIITYIGEEKEKLKKCYAKSLLNLKLDDDDDIKKFYATCKSNIECLSYISPKLEKAAALKDDTEISCEGDGECVEKAKAIRKIIHTCNNHIIIEFFKAQQKVYIMEIKRHLKEVNII